MKKVNNKNFDQVLINHENGALAHYIFRYSVGLGLESGKNYPDVGSGTLVKIGSRYFIVTAAHCIKNQQLGNVRIVYNKQENSGKFNLVKKGINGGRQHDLLDVGYIEIDKAILSEIEIEFLELDKIVLTYNLEKAIAILFGFPSKWVQVKQNINRIFNYGSFSLMTHKANKNLIPVDVNEEADIILQYPDEAKYGEEGGAFELPQPNGMSGGSIWIYKEDISNPLSVSDNAYLIGIQKSWSRQNRVVIGNKIKYFLKLIAQDYPDLKEIILQKFGELK